MVFLLATLRTLVAALVIGQAETRPAPAIRPQGALVLERLETRDIEAGAAHDWTVATEPDEYVVVAVENLEVDLSIRVLTPLNEPWREFKHSGYAGTQIVRWVAEGSPGTWTVRLTPIGGGASGRYQIRLNRRARATDPERVLVAADAVVERAERQQASGQSEEAERLLTEAETITTRAPGANSIDVSTILHRLADVRHTIGQYGEAVKLLERARLIDEKAFGPSALELAVTLNNLGYMYQMHGRYQDAEPLLKRAIEIRSNLLGANHVRTGVTLDNLAVLYISLGKFAEAEMMASRALHIFETQLGTTHYYVSFPLNILASIAQRQALYAEAEPLLKRAIAIDRERLGTRHQNYAAALRRLALNTVRLGRGAEAREMFQTALVINKEALGAEHPTVADTLWNLGRMHRLDGDYAKAQALYDQVMAIERKTLGPEHPRYASTLVEVARTHMAATPPDPVTALALLDQAIRILDEAGGSHEIRVDAYALRAQIHRGAGRQAAAIGDLSEAIRLVEELRPQIGGSEETRASFLEHYTAHFDRMIAWQAEAGDFARAFEYAERGTARALLDQLAASQLEIRHSIPADVRAGLETREDAIKMRLAELRHRIGVIRSSSGTVAQPEQSRRLDAAEAELHAAEREYVQVYVDMKNASPLWRDHFTSGGRIVSLATAQRELVPRNGLMLLYQAGTSGSQLLVVPPTGASARLVPLRVDAGTARTLNIPAGDLSSRTLTAILSGADDHAGVLDALSISALQRGVRAGQGPPTVRLNALWNILVPATLRDAVLAADEIIVVPDGPLASLPFEALVTTLDAAGPRYLLDAAPIVRYAPSATVLYGLSRRAAGRIVPQASTASVLTVSDPVYDLADAARGTAQANPPKPAAASLHARTRNSYERLGGSLARLPGTAQESDAIQKAYGVDAPRVVQALRQQSADEPSVRSALPGKRYVHLATHALVGGNQRALFAALALTPPASDFGRSESDGFLQLHEIYELKLPDLELAVLSACETNRGPSVDGEGVFALSRGFMAVGARRVIASQWAVDDQSTATLMRSLFEQIVAADRAGRPVDFARALRDARRQVRSRPAWSDPYHWAPFVLTGVK